MVEPDVLRYPDEASRCGAGPGETMPVPPHATTGLLEICGGRTSHTVPVAARDRGQVWLDGYGRRVQMSARLEEPARRTILITNQQDASVYGGGMPPDVTSLHLPVGVVGTVAPSVP